MFVELLFLPLKTGEDQKKVFTSVELLLALWSRVKTKKKVSKYAEPLSRQFIEYVATNSEFVSVICSVWTILTSLKSYPEK